MLATFVALLCLMPAMAKTVINVTGKTATVIQSSTLYVGEVVLDGQQSFYYLYSEDLTNYQMVFDGVKSALLDFNGGMFSALVPSYVEWESEDKGLAVCSNADYTALMNSDWTSAANAGLACLNNVAVSSSSSNDLYETDADFAAMCSKYWDEDGAECVDNARNPWTFSGILGKLTATNTDNVTYSVEEGELVKHITRHIDYTCEAVTVIYTRVELSSPLTFEAVEDGTVTVAWDEYSTPTLDAIQYKLNDGEWTYATWDTPIDVAANDVICFRGNNGSCYDETIWAGFHLECSNDCYVYGNVMSLIDQDGYATNTTLTKPYAFYHLFNKHDWTENATILNHPTKDIVLPATTMTDNCYDGMFQDCKGITRAPELPAMSLAEWCYCAMFMNCSNLQAAPVLPATTLVNACYPDMFIGCTSLTAAPELPAATLAEGCYSSMFVGCSNLNYVKCLATDISADYCTANWLYNVAATGTFVKATDMTSWTVGPDADDNISGIPTGWTVRTDGEYTVTIPTSGIATFSASENVTIPAGLTAYTCTTYDNDASTISAQSISGGVIPAETGVLLRGTAGETYILTATADEAVAIDDNALVAVTVPTHVAATDGDYTNFMLKSEQFVKIADAPTTSKMPANKAYLQIATASLPTGDGRSITLVWDETTSINDLNITPQHPSPNTQIYNIQGRRVGQGYKGIVIENGKKYVK